LPKLTEKGGMRTHLRSILFVSAVFAMCSSLFLSDTLWTLWCDNNATQAGCVMKRNAPLPQPSPISEPPTALIAAGLDAATRAIFTSPSGISRGQVIPVDTPQSTAEQVDQELRLAFEADYTGADTFNYVNASNLLNADDFPQRLGQFADETQSDEDATAQTHVYRQIAERAIIISGAAMQLVDLTCGIRICIGEIAGGNKDSYAEWAVSFHHEAELGVGFQRRTLTTPTGQEVMRFMFYGDSVSMPGKSPSAVDSEG
jgi:hypothetical protein